MAPIVTVRARANIGRPVEFCRGKMSTGRRMFGCGDQVMIGIVQGSR